VVAVGVELKGAVASATGALEVFVIDLPAVIYKRSTGALEVFSTDLPAVIYK